MSGILYPKGTGKWISPACSFSAKSFENIDAMNGIRFISKGPPRSGLQEIIVWAGLLLDA